MQAKRIIRGKFLLAGDQFADAVCWAPSKVSSLLGKSDSVISQASCSIEILWLIQDSKKDWDEMSATWATVILNGKSDWRMYYSGRDRHMRIRIGLAFSNDGIHWKKHANNPILNVGRQDAWDSHRVYCPIVWKERASWKMLFTGRDSPNSMHCQVGLAESNDGITWRKADQNPVFDNSTPSTINHFGQPETEAWGLLREEDKYYLFYNSVTRKPRQIYVAESSDLIAWKTISDRPVLASEGLPWSMGYMKYSGWPYRHEQELYLLAAMSDRCYSKSRIGLWKLSKTVSSMSSKFIGYLLSTSYQWCKREVETPFVIRESDEKRLLCYFGGRSGNIWTEGLAIFDKGILPK